MSLRYGLPVTDKDGESLGTPLTKPELRLVVVSNRLPFNVSVTDGFGNGPVLLATTCGSAGRETA